jgi:hypothetical protein
MKLSFTIRRKMEDYRKYIELIAYITLEASEGKTNLTPEGYVSQLETILKDFKKSLKNKPLIRTFKKSNVVPASFVPNIIAVDFNEEAIDEDRPW